MWTHSNQSWDHDSHIQLSYLYLMAACLTPSALFFALAPEIRARHPAHWQGANCSAWRCVTVKSRAAQLAFHAMWISPLLAVAYLHTYKDREDESWRLSVCEHCMSFFQIISSGVVLTKMIRESEKDPAPYDIGAGLLAELQRQSDTP